MKKNTIGTRNKSIKELRLEKLRGSSLAVVETTPAKKANDDIVDSIIDTVITTAAIDLATSIFSGGSSDDSDSGGGDFSGGGGDFSGGGASGEF